MGRSRLSLERPAGAVRTRYPTGDNGAKHQSDLLVTKTQDTRIPDAVVTVTK
jgi:hypothetical protein